MTREKEAGRARGLRGKAEAAGGKLSLELGLTESGDERAALQPLFQRPGGVLRRPCLDDEQKRGIEALSDEARAVRATPFARGGLSEAPEHEVPASPLSRAVSDRGKGEGERCRGVAVGGRLDLVQSRLPELVEQKRPPGMERRHART